MNILAWILLGAVAGWIASLVADTNEEQGLIGNILVGIAGALLGGFLVSLIGGEGITGFNLYSLIVSIGGAILILILWKQIILKIRR